MIDEKLWIQNTSMKNVLQIEIVFLWIAEYVSEPMTEKMNGSPKKRAEDVIGLSLIPNFNLYGSIQPCSRVQRAQPPSRMRF